MITRNDRKQVLGAGTSKDQGDLERALLGCALLEPARVLVLAEKRKVAGEWFTEPEAKKVWEAMIGLWRTRGEADAILIAQAIGNKAVVAYLTSCVEKATSASYAAGYIEQLASNLLTRKVAELGKRLMADAFELGGQEALNRAEGAMGSLREEERGAYGGFKKIGDFEEEIVRDYELVRQKRIVEGDSKFFIGLRLPWDVLNVKYTGVKPGIHIVAARPSQGKTAIAVNLAAGLAYNGVKQLFFSVDMHPRLLAERFGAFLGQISLPKLNFGGSKEDVEKLKRGLWRARHAGAGKDSKDTPENVLISDAYRIDRILGEIHRAVKYDGVKAVWLDYLQILSGDGQYASHKEEIDDVLGRLKQTALNLGIPIFCLAQLNRENGKDPTRKPQLTDLGDSGSIEREASTVLILWKDPDVRRKWDEEPPLFLAMGQESLASKLEPMWLILAKNQQGATGEMPFILYKNYFMFRPAEHEAVPNLTRDGSGRVIKMDRSPYFECVRDDFLALTRKDGTGLDDYLRRAQTLGFRGLRNMNKREVEA